MNTNINVELIESHIITNINNNNNNNNNDNNINNNNTIKKSTKIKNYDFFSINEICISKSITKIPYYTNNFDIIKEYNFIKTGQINEKVIDIVNTSNTDKCILCEYNDRNAIDFNVFLFHLPNPKLFIFHTLDSYSYLLNSLLFLSDINVRFFDLYAENIVFNDNYKPILKNFQNSLQVKRLDESYMSNIITKIRDFTNKPLEIHVLFYLIQNKEETITYSLIDIICENYMKNMSILTLFSQSYKDVYKNACIDFLTKYINKTKSNIINDILQYHSTWDNYSLSILYLHIVGNISRVFSLKGTFMSKFINILSKNIDPDPLKREHLKDTKLKYERLYDEFMDWKFISKIPIGKMDKLHEYLSN